MKKTLTFVVALLACCMLSAKSATAILFNRPQFQPHEFNCSTRYDKVLLTVPLVYKGTVILNTETLANDGNEIWNICEITDEATCKNNKDTETHCCYKVSTEKQTLPVYMTICQPCIDCFPCWALEKEVSDTPIEFVDGKIYCEAKPGKITKWNLYYVTQDKKAKINSVSKINLLDDAYGTEFFTGRRGSNPGIVYIGAYGDLLMTGKKSDYSFKYNEAYLTEGGDWVADGAVKASTAYVKSLASLAGSTTISFDGEALENECDVAWENAPSVMKINAAFSLKRDASLTKKAVTETFSTVFAKKGKNWEDCNVATPASFCEEYFLVEAGDNFDDYLEGQFGKKGYEFELLEAEDLLKADVTEE